VVLVSAAQWKDISVEDESRSIEKQYVWKYSSLHGTSPRLVAGEGRGDETKRVAGSDCHVPFVHSQLIKKHAIGFWPFVRPGTVLTPSVCYVKMALGSASALDELRRDGGVLSLHNT
jgi:hypothetical protein